MDGLTDDRETPEAVGTDGQIVTDPKKMLHLFEAKSTGRSREEVLAFLRGGTIGEHGTDL